VQAFGSIHSRNEAPRAGNGSLELPSTLFIGREWPQLCTFDQSSTGEARTKAETSINNPVQPHGPRLPPITLIPPQLFQDSAEVRPGGVSDSYRYLFVQVTLRPIALFGICTATHRFLASSTQVRVPLTFHMCIYTHMHTCVCVCVQRRRRSGGGGRGKGAMSFPLSFFLLLLRTCSRHFLTVSSLLLETEPKAYNGGQRDACVPEGLLLASHGCQSLKISSM
jgi:hypothetical protein